MKKLNTVIAVLALAVTGAVNAGQITSWTYINEAGFINPVGAIGSGEAQGTVLTGTAFEELTWGLALSNGSGGPYINGGVDDLQSSLESDTPQSGTIFTNGPAVQGTNLIHNNWVVAFAGGTLATTSFLDGLSLVPAEVDGSAIPAGPALLAPELEFQFEFIETTNHVDYSRSGTTVNSNILDGSITCPDGTQNGTGENTNGCADIFAVSSTGGAEFTQVMGNLEIASTFPIELDGDTFIYTVTTVLSGLTLLTDQACIAVGLGAGCNGFVTPEEQVNTLDAQFIITSEFVPVQVAAPSTLAIFGLGLIGLGGLARRKSNK